MSESELAKDTTTPMGELLGVQSPVISRIPDGYLDRFNPKEKTTFEWMKHNPKLPEGDPKTMAIAFETFAEFVERNCPTGREKQKAMDKILEAKDCAVRSTLQHT